MKTNQTTPDFTHRFVDDCLSDTINLMADRAISVLHLIALQFEGGDVSKMSDQIIYMSLDCVIQEIQDIQACSRAFNAKNPR